MATRIEMADADTVVLALIGGRATLAALPRRMTEEELRAFPRKAARDPVEARVALDGIAVYVRRDNPLRGLNFAELDARAADSRRGHGLCCAGSTQHRHPALSALAFLVYLCR